MKLTSIEVQGEFLKVVTADERVNEFPAERGLRCNGD